MLWKFTWIGGLRAGRLGFKRNRRQERGGLKVGLEGIRVWAAGFGGMPRPWGNTLGTAEAMPSGFLKGSRSFFLKIRFKSSSTGIFPSYRFVRLGSRANFACSLSRASLNYEAASSFRPFSQVFSML